MPRPRKLAAACVLIHLALALSISTHAGIAKRVAVLYVEDASGFDPPSGCGCISLGPVSSIFGRTKRQRQYWHLEVGFRDMLVTSLQEAPGYEPVLPEEVMAAYAALGANKRSTRDRATRRLLADELDATVLVVGRIKKFAQERAKGMVRRDISTRSAASADVVQGATGTLGMMGSFYYVDVGMDFTVYDRAGAEAFKAPSAATDTYQSGAVQSGPLQAIVSGSGAEAFLGSQQIVTSARRAPVVRHEVLDHVRFGVPGWDLPTEPNEPPNYRETLLGRVTQQVLNGFIEAMRERIGPALEDVEPEGPRSADGKVAFTSEDKQDIYINLGTLAELRTEDRFQVFRAVQSIRDPDTDELLGAIETDVGLLEVVELMRPKLSRTRILEGDALVGDVVRLVVDEAPSGEEPVAPDDADQ